MPKFKAARNLSIKDGAKKIEHVKKGESFECSQEYHDDHLAPHGHVEEASEKSKGHEKKGSKE